MSVTAYDARLAKKTAAHQRAGAAAGAGKATDQAVQQAYEMGLAGERLTFDEGDDPRLRDAHRLGLDERAKARRRQHASNITRATGGYLSRVGRSVTDRTGDIPIFGGGGTFVGVLVGVLLLVALFLGLNKSNAVTGLINGVVHTTTWLVSPAVLPF